MDRATDNMGRIEGIFIEGMYGGGVLSTRRRKPLWILEGVGRRRGRRANIHYATYPFSLGKPTWPKGLALLKAGEGGGSRGLKLGKRGFIEAAYTNHSYL